MKKDTPLKEVLELAKHCDRCGHCCKHSPGFVLKEEVKAISEALGITSEEFIEQYLDSKEVFNREVYKFKTKNPTKPFGECVFYLDGCKIHSIKPLHCKIGNCKSDEFSAWFTVNYLVNFTDPESIRQFKIYCENGGKVLEGGDVTDLVDAKKLKEICEYKLK